MYTPTIDQAKEDLHNYRFTPDNYWSAADKIVRKLVAEHDRAVAGLKKENAQLREAYDCMRHELEDSRRAAGARDAQVAELVRQRNAAQEKLRQATVLADSERQCANAGLKFLLECHALLDNSPVKLDHPETTCLDGRIKNLLHQLERVRTELGDVKIAKALEKAGPSTTHSINVLWAALEGAGYVPCNKGWLDESLRALQDLVDVRAQRVIWEAAGKNWKARAEKAEAKWSDLNRWIGNRDLTGR